jgi:peptidoglycan/xylan/chitin deacetylase (PgdA/CDA1 family)
MLSRLWYTGLRSLGITALARHLRNAGVILCYHNVVATAAAQDGGNPVLHIPLAAFERQMRWLAAHCEVVSLSAFVQRMHDGASLRRLASVTFDDGYAGVFEHAWPLLQALQIPASVFIVADAPGRATSYWWDNPRVQRDVTPARRQKWLTELRGDGEAILGAAIAGAGARSVPPSHLPATWAVLRQAVASGMTLGVHSATHRSLTELTDDELGYELITSRAVIARETGANPTFFAYPYGLWNPRVQRAVRAAGYRAAFTLDAGRNPPGTDACSLRRVNVPAGIHNAAFEAWASGLALRRDGL